MVLRFFEFDIRSHDAAEHTIRLYDPHGLLHHRARGKDSHAGETEDPKFYEGIAKTVASPARIAVVVTAPARATRHII